MPRSNLLLLLLGSLTLAASTVLLAACFVTEEPAPEPGDVAAARADYTVQLSSFTAEPAPASDAAGEDAAEATAVAAEAAAEGAVEGEGEGEGEGEDDLDPEEGPTRSRIIFDLLVHFEGPQALDHLTVDVTQTRGADEVVTQDVVTIDTAWLESGQSNVEQVELTVDEYEEGDTFAVTLTSGVPADLSRYPEFAEPLP